MSSCEVLPYFLSEDLLIAGYMKRNCSSSIPAALANIIKLYYVTILHIHIANELYSKFIAMTDERCVKTKTFTFKNIINDINLSFYCLIYPNLDNDGYIQINLKFLPLVTRIKFMVIHLVIACDDTDIFFTNTLKIDNQNTSKVWPQHMMQLKKYTNHNDKNALDFSVLVEILKMEYVDNDKNNKLTHYYYKDDILMKKEVNNFEWTIADKLLSEFKSLSAPLIKGYFSSYFDDEYKNWICAITPFHKLNADGTKQFYVTLYLCRLPPNIKLVFCDLSVNVHYDGRIIKDERNNEDFGYDAEYNVNTLLCRFSKPLSQINKLKISVNIKIIKLIDGDDNEIFGDEFSKYGVL